MEEFRYTDSQIMATTKCNFTEKCLRQLSSRR